MGPISWATSRSVDVVLHSWSSRCVFNNISKKKKSLSITDCHKPIRDERWNLRSARTTFAIYRSIAINILGIPGLEVFHDNLDSLLNLDVEFLSPTSDFFTSDPDVFTVHSSLFCSDEDEDKELSHITEWLCYFRSVKRVHSTSHQLHVRRLNQKFESRYHRVSSFTPDWFDIGADMK